MTKLVEGLYRCKTAKEDLSSTSGEKILAGDTFFENEEANSILTLNEGEVELLGLKDYSTAIRKQMAKSGEALPDGSYPIKNCADVSDALHRIGTGTKHSKAEIEAHIRSRAKALGCSMPGSKVLNN